MRMDNKNLIKKFITATCDWVEYIYKRDGHDNFLKELSDNKLAYLIADKGIEKRIQKQLIKRLGLQSRVKYNLAPSSDRYFDGTLYIQIFKEYDHEEWYKQNYIAK